MKISTATSVFVNYPIQAAIQEVIRAGFDGIDLWCGRPHIYRKDHDPEVLKSIRQTLEERQVLPAALMPAFFRYPYSLSSPNEVVRQDSIAYVKDCIKNAVALGAPQVLIVPGRSLHGQTLKEARALFLDSLRPLCRYAEEQEIQLGLEMLNPQLSDYMCTSLDAVEAIRALASPCLGAVVDTGHVQLSGEKIEDVFANLKGQLLQVHINDNDGKEQQNAIPGEGVIDFRHVFRLLREIQFKGYLTLELGWHYSFDPYPAVFEALTRVRSLLAETAQ